VSGSGAVSAVMRTTATKQQVAITAPRGNAPRLGTPPAFSAERNGSSVQYSIAQAGTPCAAWIASRPR
jgi:hypothetical protein